MPSSPLRPDLRACVSWVAVLLQILCGLVAATPADAQLVVAIEANPGVAVPGEQLEVRVTVANQGGADVAGVVLNLPIPAQLDQFLIGSSVSSVGAVGCNQIVNNFLCSEGETVGWNFGTLVAGQTVTASLAPIVAETATGSITFNPVLNSGPSSSASVSIDAGLSLDVSLNEAADPVAAGGALAYGLYFGNRSAVDTAPNALLRLPLPAGTTFVSASDGGVLNAGAVEWSLGTLQPGQSGTRSVLLAADAGLPRGGLLLAAATLSDSSPQQAVARAVTGIDGLEPLELRMSAGPDPAAPGELLDLELTVSNRSAVARSGVSLALRWPEEIASTLVGRGTSGPDGCNQIVNDFPCTAGEWSVWSLGTLAAGQSVTVSYSSALAAAPDGAIVDFRATVVGTTGDDLAEVARSIAVDATSPLDVSIQELRDPVAAGADLAYTIFYGNASTTDAAPSALLRLPLPAGTTFVSASGGGALVGGEVQWSLGTLQPGQSGTRSVVLETGAGLVDGTLLSAEVALSDALLPAQLARASAVTEVDPLASLQVALVVAPDPVAPGEQVDLEFTVSNASASSLASVSLVLRWPHETASTLIGRGTSGPVGCNQIVNDFPCTPGEFSVWNLGTLAAGQRVTVTYSAELAAAPDGTIVEYEAFALAASAAEQARVGRAIAVDATSPLDVALHESIDPVGSGEDLAYSIAFGNRSTTDPAPNALLRLPLPAGTTFVSASGGGALVGSAVEWSLGTLQPGQAGERSVVLETDAGLAAGTLLLAEVTLSDTSLPAQLARARAETEVDDQGALELAMVVGSDPVAPGELFDVELTVSNTSASPVSSASLVLRWPREIASTLIGRGTSSPVGCNQIVNDFPCTAGEFSVWNLGTLAAGQSVTVSYSTSLATVPDGTIVELEAMALHTATADWTRAARAIAVDMEHPLELGLSESADPVASGDELVYTLSFVNRTRDYTAPNALLRLPIPSGTTFVSASDGGAFNAGAVEWSLGAIKPGQSGTRSITLETDPGLISGTLLQAAASLADTSVPSRVAWADAVTEIDGAEALEASIAVTLDQTDWAHQIDVTVTNTDAVSHTGVTLTLRVPRDALSFSIGTATGASASGCNQIVNDFPCTPGEFLVFSIGTLTAGQSVVVRVPNLYVQVPSADMGELMTVTAIALGSGTDDRATARAVPEPRAFALLVAGVGGLGLLGRGRMRRLQHRGGRRQPIP